MVTTLVDERLPHDCFEAQVGLMGGVSSVGRNPHLVEMQTVKIVGRARLTREGFCHTLQIYGFLAGR